METLGKRITNSFVKLKEVLGFGTVPQKRTIVLDEDALKVLREEVKSNVVKTS